MNEDALRGLLARLMVIGVIAAAVVMLAGGVWWIVAHGSQPTGDHVFRGEPADLRSPGAIVGAALKGSDPALIQVGVLLLLLNPFVRVAFAAAGYAGGRDWLYAGVSLFVLAMLGVSFFL